MSFFDKALTIVKGDIVSVTNGRSWLRARVLETLPDNMLLVRFKDGHQTKVSADHVLTEEEKKNFRKSKGQTNIIRNRQQGFDEDVEPESGEVQDTEQLDEIQSVESTSIRSRFNKLF